MEVDIIRLLRGPPLNVWQITYGANSQTLRGGSLALPRNHSHTRFSREETDGTILSAGV